MTMRYELSVKLVRKPTASKSTKKAMTAEDVRKAMSERARKILNGEAVESLALRVNAY